MDWLLGARNMMSHYIVAMIRKCLIGTLLLVNCSVAIALETAAKAPAKLPAADCLLIDTDGNLDDLRAIAIIAPFLTIRAVVVTDGMVPVRQGADFLRSFLDHLPANKAIPVLTGASRAITSPAPPGWDWLAGARTDASRVHSTMSTLSASRPQAATSPEQTLEQSVAANVKGCQAIGLVMIGPWSSFLHYQARIVDRIAFVVAQGRSPFDPTPEDNPDWDRVNCKFDRDACTFAQGVLTRVPVYWVDLPDKGDRYPITRDMIAGLKSAPLALALKGALLGDPALLVQQQWDDMAALFVLRPEAFRRDGQHYHPRLGPVMMRELERALISGQR